MKSALLLFSILVMCSGAASAQSGYIGLFSDPQGIDCDLFDNVAGLCTYYVFHQATPGAIASQFSAPLPGCMVAAIWLSDTAVFPVTIGNSQNGVAIGYGSCLAAPIHILSINIFCQGLTPTCCAYPVLPDPAVPSGQIEVVDCDNNLLVGLGSYASVNPDHSCCCYCTPVDDSTWGEIKSLYGD
ncbi:MAG: hypothetical protein JSW50_10595 [Candidatus Latescibacterota bacterium]|nr:MAG: hypothetical protein JSW50_10595 [Candidatus Latescibacterota bacterium]